MHLKTILRKPRSAKTSIAEPILETKKKFSPASKRLGPQDSSHILFRSIDLYYLEEIKQYFPKLKQKYSDQQIFFSLEGIQTCLIYLRCEGNVDNDDAAKIKEIQKLILHLSEVVGSPKLNGMAMVIDFWNFSALKSNTNSLSSFCNLIAC